MSDTDYSKNTFYSPVAPLQHHMQRVYEAVLYLPDVLAAMIAEDWQVVEATQKKIVRAERASAEIHRQIRQHLPESLFMPTERRDVLEVLTLQDRIVRQTKEIAGLVLSRRMDLPVDMHVPILTFGQICVDCVAGAYEVIEGFNELVEQVSGAAPPDADARVAHLIDTLNETCNEADNQRHDLQAVLFSHEQDMSPVDVMFTYRIIGALGEITDHAQRVSGRIQLMLAR